MGTRDINLELLRLLGIDPKNTTGLDLRMRANELPTVLVNYVFVDGSQLRPLTRKFEVHLVEEPVDLAAMEAEFRQGIAERYDPMVADAKRRLAQSLNDDVARHQAQMRTRRPYQREIMWRTNGVRPS